VLYREGLLVDTIIEYVQFRYRAAIKYIATNLLIDETQAVCAYATTTTVIWSQLSQQHIAAAETIRIVQASLGKDTNVAYVLPSDRRLSGSFVCLQNQRLLINTSGLTNNRISAQCHIHFR
jgi:hypothetical protein